MKTTGRLKKAKKKTVVIFVIVISVLVILAAGAVFVIRNFRGNRDDSNFGGMQGFGTGFSGFSGFSGMSEGMVTASGVTNMGVTEESFDVEGLATGLAIEEVYVVSGDTVTEGTKVLKLSEENILQARKELEQKLKKADLAYRAGAIEYEQDRIKAEYERDSRLLEGEQAKEVYDETMSGLQASVDKAEKALEETREEIAEYRSYVNTDSYRTYFKLDEYQAVYDETLEVLKDKMEEWGVSWPQVTGQGGMNMGNAMSSGQAAFGGAGNKDDASTGMPEQNTGPSSDQIQVLASLYDVLEVQREELDQAESDYEDALANASFELRMLELKLPGLEQALDEAEKKYKTQVLQAQLAYETSLANAESAQSNYETAIQKAELDYGKLKKEREDAEENLALFESSVGDGYFYASGSGTILRIAARAGQDLVSEEVVFMYSNPGDMTVAVSVNQSDIAKIALGDSVYIQSSRYGGYEGVVAEVDPVSVSGSRTSVSYHVTVKVIGGTGRLSANESVTVIFGRNIGTGQNAAPHESGISEDGRISGEEGTEYPKGMEPSEGMGFPGGGRRPQDGENPGWPQGDMNGSWGGGSGNGNRRNWQTEGNGNGTAE